MDNCVTHGKDYIYSRKTTVIYVKFFHDVPCQKLFKSANVSRSYSKNNTGTDFFCDTVYIRSKTWQKRGNFSDHSVACKLSTESDSERIEEKKWPKLFGVRRNRFLSVRQGGSINLHLHVFVKGFDPKNLSFLWGVTDPYLTQSVLGPHKCACQKISKSVERFKQGARVWQTDDRPRYGEMGSYRRNRLR